METLHITRNDAGQRLDKFLTKSLPTLPMSLMYKYIRLKKIKRNARRTAPNERLEEGDVLTFHISPEFFEASAADEAFRHIRPDLRIVYEDENLILVDKKPGMIVHSDDREAVDTLITHIQAYLWQKGEYDPEKELSFAPALCNRIDRNTGGIVIAAKNAEALRNLNEKIQSKEIRKFYLCLVHGVPQPREGMLRSFLRKDEAADLVRVYDSPVPGGRTAETLYRVLEVRSDAGFAEPVSLVEAELLTGRTHQIRAQFSSIGHPLVGDGKYGVNRADRQMGFPHQALYSYKIQFAFTDEGPLSYLNGRTFEVESVPFAEPFRK